MFDSEAGLKPEVGVYGKTGSHCIAAAADRRKSVTGWWVFVLFVSLLNQWIARQTPQVSSTVNYLLLR